MVRQGPGQRKPEIALNNCRRCRIRYICSEPGHMSQSDGVKVDASLLVRGQTTFLCLQSMQLFVPLRRRPSFGILGWEMEDIGRARRMCDKALGMGVAAWQRSVGANSRRKTCARRELPLQPHRTAVMVQHM